MPELDFRNVDLEMMFAKAPEKLLRELGRKVFVLYSGPHPKGHLVALELSQSARTKNDPIRLMRGWFKLLRTLSPAARRELSGASSRVFDLGFDVREAKATGRIELPDELAGELAKLRASYVITLYAAEADSSATKPRKQRRS